MIHLPEKIHDVSQAQKILTHMGLLIQINNSGNIFIGKPHGMGGRVVDGYDGLWEGDIRISCPAIKIYQDNGKWIVSVWQHRPGPGPGDFRHEHADLRGCVKEALEWLGL
jgi:hypothetical protein